MLAIGAPPGVDTVSLEITPCGEQPGMLSGEVLEHATHAVIEPWQDPIVDELGAQPSGDIGAAARNEPKPEREVGIGDAIDRPLGSWRVTWKSRQLRYLRVVFIG